MAAEQGIEALAAFMANRSGGDRHKGLFWAACRAAEEGLEPGPLIGAALAVGLPPPEVEQTIASARATIAKARREHEEVHPQ